MDGLVSLILLSYLTLFALAVEDKRKDTVFDHELRLPYECPAILLAGSASLTITLPYSYFFVIPVISDFANVDWEYNLLDEDFPYYTLKETAFPSLDSPARAHSNQTINSNIPRIPVTLDTLIPSPGSTRFYTLPNTGITIFETLLGLHNPSDGPFTLIHSIVPIYLPPSLNLTIGSPFTSISAIPVCDRRATQITFASDFCASNANNASLFLDAKLHGTSVSLHRIFGGHNFTGCEDLPEHPDHGYPHNYNQSDNDNNNMPLETGEMLEQSLQSLPASPTLRPTRGPSGSNASVATMTTTTATLWPEPTNWSEHVENSALKIGPSVSAAVGSATLSGQAVAWWKMFGAGMAAATAMAGLPL